MKSFPIGTDAVDSTTTTRMQGVGLVGTVSTICVAAS
jgi:hypothetical protein